MTSVWDLRSSLGYDMATLAALGVSESQYDAIAAAAIARMRREDARLAPLLETYRSSRETRVASCGTPLTFGPASDQVEGAAQVIASTESAFAQTLRAQLTPEQQAIHDRALANHGLDGPLALVSGIDDAQRLQLKAAQRERDRVLLDPLNSHRQAPQQEAQAMYDHVLPQILTSAQLQEYQVLCERAESNLKAFGARELAAIAAAQLQAAAPPKALPLGPPSELLHAFFRSVGQAFHQWTAAQAAVVNRTVRGDRGQYGRAGNQGDARGLAVALPKGG